MQKLLFFDYYAVQSIDNLIKKLNCPIKCKENPLFIADLPWELGNFTMYGSVIKIDKGPFQAWYSIISKPWRFYLSYAESDDGYIWHRPNLGHVMINGQQTNIVLDNDPHGPAVIYDTNESNREKRYKMLCGAKPADSIYGFYSADGINWQSEWRYPVITSGPDCPMGLLRLPDGRYVAYHRVHGNGRRVFRSESWDFRHWDCEPKLVFEPDAHDPPLIQFYGLGSAVYGPYEIGTLWVYHVDPSDLSGASGYQETELAYARSGYAWHRAMSGSSFIAHGHPGEWDQGNLQSSSAPVFLDDEIRYYYASTRINHSRYWELLPQCGGLGMASIKPDRFVGLSAEQDIGCLITMPKKPKPGRLSINAQINPGGYVKASIIDAQGYDMPEYGLINCIPVTEDTLDTEIMWENVHWSQLPTDQSVRIKLEIASATVYALILREFENNDPYYRFSDWS